MTKEKITLSGRQRTKELRAASQVDVDRNIQNDSAAYKLQQQAVELQQQQVEIKKEDKYIQEIVTALAKKYEIWSEPLDNWRYKYSPNKRSQLLLNEIRCILNDHAKMLLAEGYQDNTCKNKCLDLLNIISDELRKCGVPIGDLHLTSKKRR